MVIKRKRIHNPQRYLYALHPGDMFYVAADLSEKDVLQLTQYGISPNEPARIPIPNRSATQANANGKWFLLRELPKKIRFFCSRIPFGRLAWERSLWNMCTGTLVLPKKVNSSHRVGFCH